MRSYLQGIVLLNKSGEKRTVHLRQGVNIVTGESKTGKSALVEIIDYCLCSSHCTVPKGKITEFTYLYVVPMVIRECTYIIARYSWEFGGKMYVVKENIDFDLHHLNLTYFEQQPILSYKEAQYEIENALGLSVKNIETDAEKKNKKASLRNMVSYLFQHQNLMASKFALFYRFADFYKRKDVISQFPVFAGIIGQEYYSELIELDSLKSQLKQKQKVQKANEKSSKYIKDNLSPLLKDYFALLEMPFDDAITVQKMLSIAKRLPEFDDSKLFSESGITDRYHSLNVQLEDLRNQERELLLKIKSIGDVSETGNAFAEMLHNLKEQTDTTHPQTNDYICPLCGNDCVEIKENDKQVDAASGWLTEELRLTQKYTDNFSEEARILREQHGNLEAKIKDVWNQIKTIERKFIDSKELVSKREKVNYAKARIQLYVDMNSSGVFESVDQDIVDLQEKIKRLSEQIQGFDVDTKMAKAQSFLSDNMNKLANSLDFEEEYRPIDLNFGLLDSSFDIYQLQRKHEKIYLYEMGSGANWVSCHIALFLSFLRYFASQRSSPMPLFMFFDQPSQVYFPQGSKQEELTPADIKAVNSMYKTIFNEINSIGADTGILPQIIIVDHVDGLGLEIQDEFESYIRANWRNGKALI